MVPVLSSFGTILGGLYALYFIRKNFDIKFGFQKVKTLKYYLNEAHHIFISNLAISLYTISTTFILGIFTNNTIVGYFASADKIIQAFKGLMGPVSQTIYPYIAKKTNNSKEEGLKFIKKITFYIAIFTASVSAFVFFGAEFLVNLLLGAEYQNSIIVVQLLALMPLLIGLSNMFGIQTMLNFGRKKPFSKILIAGSILNLILSFILVPLYQHIGSAISVLIVESFITIVMFIYIQNNGLKIIGENKNV
jgi:PST family polysaccharide transporter